MRCVAVLDEAMAGDPLVAREQLRRLFDGGQLQLQPQKEGTYVAEGQIDLRVLFSRCAWVRLLANADTPGATEAPLIEGRNYLWSSGGCAGTNRPTSTSDEPPIPLTILVPPAPDRRKMPWTWKRRVA